MKVIVTGGAGFIGSNVAHYYLQKGWTTVVVDNISRKGTEVNLKWLKEQGLHEFMAGNLANNEFCELVFSLHRDADLVIHLAGQVAVTTSIIDPKADYEGNCHVGFNVLECIRRFTPEAVAIYSSTNKVYGELKDYQVRELDDSYELVDFPHGVDEQAPLDFHSPYGVSKGSVDQYFLDYSRIYGLKTVVCRQSCIYGTRQFGNEDQGWVAWFMLANLRNSPITIYGNGKQVRDLLWIDDLVELYDVLYEKASQNDHKKVTGQSFNVGGGNQNAISLLNGLGQISGLTGKGFNMSSGETRAGDQPYFVADIRKIYQATGWQPETNVKIGLDKLYAWLKTVV